MKICPDPSKLVKTGKKLRAFYMKT